MLSSQLEILNLTSILIKIKQAIAYFLNNYFFLPLILFAGCSSSTELKQLSGIALGTSYQIKYFSNNLKLENLEIDLDSIFDELNQSLSTYNENSIISRFNKGNNPVKIDEHFHTVYQKSLEIWEKTGGYFDPTVASMVNALGLGSQRQENIDLVMLDSLKQFIGFNKLKVSNGVITKSQPEVTIDFNAIAKGYVIDVISKHLQDSKVTNYLIELGGEVLGMGINLKSKKKWSIGIENPVLASSTRLLKTIELQDKAQATSGNYRKFWVDPVTETKYVHSVNPITGEAFQSEILSVSVTSRTCMEADAYATTLMVMSFEDGLELIEKDENLEALWIMSDDYDEIVLYQSSRFGQ